MEVAKIKMARFQGKRQSVLVHILTFNVGTLDYSLLNEDFKTMYFQEMYCNDHQIKVNHWYDFLSYFVQDYKEILTLEEEEILNRGTYIVMYQNDSVHVIKSVLNIIAKVLDKVHKNVIIMIDELPINMTCKPMQVLGRKTYEADFSFLNKYQNVHFIICFHPAAGTNDFELIFPSEQPGQLYKLLGSRYRNAQMILEFLRFWQKIFLQIMFMMLDLSL